MPPWLAKYKIFPLGLIQMLLLLNLLVLLVLLLLLYVFDHKLIWGREAPPYNYVINAYSRSSSRSSSKSSRPSSSRDILAIFSKMFRPI